MDRGLAAIPNSGLSVSPPFLKLHPSALRRTGRGGPDAKPPNVSGNTIRLTNEKQVDNEIYENSVNAINDVKS